MAVSKFEKSIRIAVGLDQASESVAKLDQAVKATIELHRLSESVTKSMKNTVIEQQALIETQKHHINNIKSIQQSNLTIGNISKGNLVVADKMMKSSEKEAELIKNVMAKAWTDIDKTLALKNLKHVDELKYVQSEGDALTHNLKIYDGIRDNVRDLSTATENYFRHMFNVYQILKNANDASENFNTANYRIYGTQIKITEEAYRTASAYGLMTEEVVQAYKALGAQRLTKNIEDFKRLGFEAGAFSRATGMSIEATVNLQKALVSTTGSLDQTSQYMVRTIGYMREFGLSTENVNGLLAQHSAKLLELRALYGALAVNITDAQLRLAALAKEFGGSDAMVNKAGTSLQNVGPITKQLIAGFAEYSGEIESAAGQTKLFAALTKKAFTDIASETDPAQREVMIRMYKRMAGEFGDSAIYMADQLKSQGKTVADLDEALARLNTTADKAKNTQKTFYDELQDASNTIPRTLGLMSDAVHNIIGSLWNTIAPGVLVILKVLNGVVQAISWVITKFNQLLDALGPVGTGLKIVAGLFLVGWAAMAIFGKALGVIGIAIRGLVGFMVGLISKIPLLSAGFTSFTTAIANALRALVPMAPALIALGVLFAGVGIAAWGLATAVEKLAAVGAKGVLYLGLMMGALIGLGVAFAYIGRIATAGAPGLLALGAALAGIGIAAYGISTLITAIGDNWRAALAAGGLLVGVILAMSFAIGVLATVGVGAAGPLLALGASLLMIAGAAYIAGLGLGLIIDALNKMTVGSAVTLIGLAIGLTIAGSMLLAAGVPLRKSAFELMMASAMMLGASLLLASAAIPFIFGASSITAGSVVLLIGATMLRAASLMLKPAADALSSAAPDLLKASLKLTIAMAQFKVSMDGSVLKASAILLGSATMILIGAGVLAIGAPILLFASGILLTAVNLLVVIAPLFEKAVNGMFKSTIRLMAVSATILAASVVLLVGGGALLLGSLAIGLASAILLISGIALMAASVLLGLAVGILHVAGAGMVTAAALLATGALALGVAAIPIGVAAIAIGIAGLAIWLASKPLQWGADNLKIAGHDFLEAGQLLVEAGPLLAAGIASIDKGTDGITRIGLSMWVGSKAFGKGADEFKAAVVPIAEAATMLANGLNSIDTALAKPYASMFSAFSQSLSAASEPMLAMLDDVSTKMVGYAAEIEGSSKRISASFGTVGTPDEKAQNAQQANPVARDGAAMLSPDTVAASADSEKKNKLLQEQISLLSAIAANLVELVKKGISTTSTDNSEVLNQIKDAIVSMGGDKTDRLANHMTNWGHS